jgi:hypothetical protein
MNASMQQIFRHFCDHSGTQGLRQSRAQQPEESGSAHHDQAVEIPTTLGLFELRGDAPRKRPSFVLARRRFTARGMVRCGAATSRSKGSMVELASRSVGHEVAIV